MSAPAAIITRCTVWPLMSIPRISEAFCSASSGDLAIFTPPALPRPPVFTWALTTTTGVPSFSAPALAAAGSSATTPPSTGTPCFSKRSRAWYSYRSTGCFSSRCRQWAAGRTGLDATPGNTARVTRPQVQAVPGHGRERTVAGLSSRPARVQAPRLRWDDEPPFPQPRPARARPPRIQHRRHRGAVHRAAPAGHALDPGRLRAVRGRHPRAERRPVVLLRAPRPEPAPAAGAPRRRGHPLPRGRPAPPGRPAHRAPGPAGPRRL